MTMMSRDVRDGAPTAMRMRVQDVPARARRAQEDRAGPLEVRLGDHWYEVADGDVGPRHASLLLGDRRWVHQRPDTTVWVRWGLGTGEEWVYAPDLRAGDVVHNLGDVAWTVREVTDRLGVGPAAGTTWVVLRGDNEEGYFAKFHGGETEYLAYMDEPVAVSWPRPGELEG